MRPDHLKMLKLSAALLGLTSAELALAYGHRLRRGLVRAALGASSRHMRALTP